MDQKQFDAMLSDGETRLTRLKMLYEQWFLGFERIEPQILRKEFEDLLAMLRREQVGNTALRFRLQQLVQRHTTFATHWRRVARQIEDGTYQRDVLRARRLREQTVERDNGGPELELSYDVDLDDELQAALDEVHRAAETAAARPQPSAAGSPVQAETAVTAAPAVASGGRAAVRPPLGAWGPARAPEQPTPAAGAPPAAADGAPPEKAAARPNPPRAISPFAMPSATGAKPPVPPSAAALLGAIGGANSVPANLNAGVANGAAKPGVASAPAKTPSAAAVKAVGALLAAGAKAGAPTVGAGAKVSAAGAAATANAAVTPAGHKPAIAAAGAAPAAAGVGAKPAAPAGSASVATNAKAGAVAAAASAPAIAAKAAAGPANTPPRPAAAATAPATLTAAQKPAAPVAKPAGAPPMAARPAAAGGGALSNDDVQRIYSQYVNARKQNAERVDNVKLDSIEKTLRGMLPQLEKKHAGKKIDFEVVVKDGKVALKPVAR